VIDNLRHESGSEGLEERGNGDSEAREVGTETSAESEDTSKEGDGSEEESDQVESEHETRQVVVVVSSNEGLRNALGAAKVSWGVERTSRDGVTAVCVEAILFTAEVEESPAQWVAGRGRSICCVDLDEVCLVERSRVGHARQDDKELEEKSCAQEDEGNQSQDRSCELC
jgi:hypothetical protein